MDDVLRRLKGDNKQQERSDAKLQFHGADLSVMLLWNFIFLSFSFLFFTEKNAGYTATPVTCGWAGAIIEVTPSFGQEQ